MFSPGSSLYNLSYTASQGASVAFITADNPLGAVLIYASTFYYGGKFIAHCGFCCDIGGERKKKTVDEKIGIVISVSPAKNKQNGVPCFNKIFNHFFGGNQSHTHAHAHVYCIRCLHKTTNAYQTSMKCHLSLLGMEIHC